MINKNYWKEKEQQPMEITESSVDGIVMKLKYEVKKTTTQQVMRMFPPLKSYLLKSTG